LSWLESYSMLQVGGEEGARGESCDRRPWESIGSRHQSSAQRAWVMFGWMCYGLERRECGAAVEKRWVRDIKAHRTADHEYAPSLARCVSKSCRRRCGGGLRSNGARLPAGRARKASLCGRGWWWMFICARAFVLRNAPSAHSTIALRALPYHHRLVSLMLVFPHRIDDCDSSPARVTAVYTHLARGITLAGQSKP
jgi:hypothetical protein